MAAVWPELSHLVHRRGVSLQPPVGALGLLQAQTSEKERTGGPWALPGRYCCLSAR